MNCKKVILLMIMMFTVSGCVQRNSNQNSDIPVGSGIAKDYKPRSANEGAVPVKVNIQNEPETFKLDQTVTTHLKARSGTIKLDFYYFLITITK
ncbi:hypothetical protein KIH86_27835 [Paenibacillus sp. HN-1]|uniref:hypothetical protein n=1 Tax=Paenibacillus TaxID=44249 RepID=UPI001CA88E4E|nr:MULTISPECIES: hypothetical protein [Paenibacillus]MBY9078834.1 hypothetical protein [Paenibacillus sp. CGMCC 1.18879]MBY9088006.1 hypothetical protein [Paenibacillus sinensis]